MNPNRLCTTPKLADHASRFLEAIYGPLGPVEGITAWKAGIILAEQLTASHAGTYSLGAAIESFAMREDVPRYLCGLPRSELWRDTADYVERHFDAAPYPDAPEVAA